MEPKIKIKGTRVGNNLRNLRMDSKLTQEQVVAKMQLKGFSMTRSIYSQIECSLYNIRVTELDAFVEIFHTDYNTVFKK